MKTIAIIITAAGLVSCTVTTGPDGTVTKTPAPGSIELANKALEIIATK